MVDIDVRGWQGCTVIDRDGRRIGKIQAIYTDDQAGDETAGGYDAATDAGGYDVGGRDDAMTRSEEEVRVGTEARERGRVRLRRDVTTEQVHSRPCRCAARRRGWSGSRPATPPRPARTSPTRTLRWTLMTTLPTFRPAST
jgi:hypothetical protein